MIRQIARPLLGSFFIYAGFRALVNPAPVVDAAQPMLDTAADLNLSVTDTPVDNTTLARVYGGVQLGAGLLLATGRVPRLASLALAATLAPATITHDFWNEPDDAARHQKATQFLKDTSLMGGLLIAGFDTEGKPGVKWRARRLAERASERAAELTPAFLADDGAHLEDYVDRAKTAAVHLGERLESRRSLAAERITDAVDAARPRVAHAAQVAAERATDAGQAVGLVLDDLREGIAELRDDARDVVHR